MNFFLLFAANHVMEIANFQGALYSFSEGHHPMVIVPNFQVKQSEINLKFCCFSSEEHSK